MFKKILIPSFAFFGMSLIALYMVKIENGKVAQDLEMMKPMDQSIVVLELFTSQGCSSCPAADALLNKVKNQFPNEVLALSYHVDYWNYIGWEDPFSKSIFTKKQQDYNRKFRYPSNYTPEIVVNGKEHFVGSNSSKLYSKIASYKKEKQENKVQITDHSLSNNTIKFDFEVLGNVKGRQLRVVLVLDERITAVKRGENRNMVLKNSNIVVNENYMQLSSENGKATIVVPGIVKGHEKLSLMVLVEKNNLDITGAAKIALN